MTLLAIFAGIVVGVGGLAFLIWLGAGYQEPRHLPRVQPQDDQVGPPDAEREPRVRALALRA